MGMDPGETLNPYHKSVQCSSLGEVAIVGYYFATAWIGNNSAGRKYRKFLYNRFLIPVDCCKTGTSGVELYWQQNFTFGSAATRQHVG